MDLPLDLVVAARREEMDHMLGHTFHIVDKAECHAKTGKSPISTRWIDTDKSHGQGVMKVRSRFVARDFKKKGERDREDLFCATPPLELLRVLVSLLVTRSPLHQGRVRKMMFVDVKKAHLVPVCSEDVYIELPVEAGGLHHQCGKLEESGPSLGGSLLPGAV